MSALACPPSTSCSPVWDRVSTLSAKAATTTSNLLSTVFADRQRAKPWSKMVVELESWKTDRGAELFGEDAPDVIAIDMAIETIGHMKDIHDFPLPTSISGTVERGVSFEWRVDRGVTLIELEPDGRCQILVLIDGRVVFHKEHQAERR